MIKAGSIDKYPKIGPVEIQGQKTLYVDIDDTIAMSDLSEYSEEDRVTLNYENGPVVIVANKKNINLAIYFYKLGYTIIFWSLTGSTWARAVCESLELDKIASAYLTKPNFYMDDKEVTEWIGPRRWRSPK